MNPLSIFSFILAGIIAIVCIAITVQLARGNWLSLVAGRTAYDNPEKMEKNARCAKRMAFVTGTFALLTATIIFYKAFEVAGNASVAEIGLSINNVSFVLFIIALIAFYVMQRAYKDPMDKPSIGGSKKISSREARLARRAQNARVEAFSSATLFLLIAIIVCAFALGLLFSAF